jgi:hypothetical protein
MDGGGNENIIAQSSLLYWMNLDFMCLFCALCACSLTLLHVV